jgi:hypothetical protein
MSHLAEVINDVERYSIADVVELCVVERAEPIRRYCSSCGRDVA